MKLNIITTLVTIIIVLCISVSVQTCRVNKVIEEKDIAEASAATAIQFANKSESLTETYSNAYNNQIARTKSIEISLANVQALRNTERLKYLKQFEGLKKDLKNLQEGITVIANINEDSIPVKIVMVPCKDSIKVFQYQLVDEWNSISAMVLDTPKFDIKVPIHSVVYWQRKNKILWFRMGKKQWFIESMSPNHLIQITKQELIRVSKKGAR
jgi:hypothetical protein